MFDDTEQHIAELAWPASELAWRLVADARNAGVPLVIISGLRDPVRNREVGGAERSLHLRGLAFDVAVVGYHRDQLPLWWWRALGEHAEASGLYWGGRFLHAGRPDVNHFDARRFLA